MVTLTFAGDESGDVSFSFEKGASRYFVFAIIATAFPDALRQRLAELRLQANLPAYYEFSFNSLSSAPLRRRVFAALAEADFEGWAIIVDKTTLPDSFKVMSGLEFYLYFVTELLRVVPDYKRNGATLILDEYGSPARVRSELRRIMAIRDIPRQFKRIQIKRSKSEPLIQIADLVAGAILRRDSKGDVDAFDYIAGNMQQVLEFAS
ncbi:MAG TPA: DUF3800 domain-containing protein [Anaerolineae bacterium]|nr:DUF3800 domain-containing protein [Anaerolineae bacterium]